MDVVDNRMETGYHLFDDDGRVVEEGGVRSR